jgi:hypothetical protein
MYYSYVEIEYIATSFSPTRTDFAVKLFKSVCIVPHQSISKKDGHVGIHFSFGAKRL